MARPAVSLSCSEQDKVELERISRGRKEPRQRVERSRMILQCLDGLPNDKIAAAFSTRPNTVSKWRHRFARLGLAGLEDAARSGRRKAYAEDYEAKIVKALESPPPKGQATWDGKALAKVVGGTASAAWRFLRKKGIQLARQRSWCVSTDPQFAAKSADIIGLYLNPPQRALVISIDEKPSIQALERATGYVKTSSQKIVRGMKSTYKRHGTLNLFAALSIATGRVTTKITTTKKRPDFQAFLDDVVADIPEDREIHIIVDNYSTHKKNGDWLARHPNVFFHYTPTSASWLNMVEIWFGILSRKALRGASFQSIDSLKQSIEDFCEAYDANAKPFVWKKREVKGSQLKNTIANLRN